MKKFARIFHYIKKHSNKLVLYFICTLLATLFGVFSIAMLMPFFDLIFKGEAVQQNDMLSGNPAVAYVAGIITNVIETKGRIAGLTIICAFLVGATLFKNVFLYIS